ncbi:MAG: efflux transporter outer membrane subunit [Parachlamydiales bacterium]
MAWRRIAFFLLLSGCNLGPRYCPPKVELVNEWEKVRMERVSTEEPDLAAWWEGFGDPILDQLIACAIEHNYDLCAATERILQTREARRIAYSRFFPQIDGEFTFAKELESKNPAVNGISIGPVPFFINGWQIGFSALWEIDLFGRLRKGVAAAQADLAASVNDRRAILISLLGEVARSYVDVRGFQRRIEVAKENNERQQTTVEIVGVRVDVGIGSDLDLSEARALQRSVAAAIPPLYEQLYAAMHRLAVLCGKQPFRLHDLLSEGGPIPAPPEVIAIGLPCDVLRNRPDLKRAEWELRAASARVGVAYANLFPTISLAGVLGLDSEHIYQLFQPSSRALQIGGDLVQPVFHGGALRANVRLAQRRYGELLCQYHQRVLTSLEEVRNAIVNFEQQQIRHRLLHEAADNSRRSLELATELYKQGIVDFLRVIDAERSVSLFDDDRLAAEAQIALDAINLYVALGGGWAVECAS